MEKLLVICGPTATGKTSLALSLATKFNAELISSDSRQVYKSMDIGTGKDLPKGAKFKAKKGSLPGYYRVGKTRIWGYDLVGPKSDFSVSKYVKVIEKVLEDVIRRKKLPILVGGTGLYIKAVVDGIPTASIPKSKTVRKTLEGKPVRELFEILAQVDPIRAASLNVSDRKNPRRLIRAIEVAQWKLGKGSKKLERKSKKRQFSTLFVGLIAERRVLCQKIANRVKKREKGVGEEIESLLKKGVTWDSQSMDSLGYKEWKGFFEGKIEKSEVLKKWEKDECNYAKRQIVWFKKDKRINWFDIEGDNWRKKVEKLVKKWYKTD